MQIQNIFNCTEHSIAYPIVSKFEKKKQEISDQQSLNAVTAQKNI